MAQIPVEMHKRASEVIKRLFGRSAKESNSVALQIDEDVRLCHVTFTLYLNSDELVDQLLGLRNLV